VITEDPTTP